MGLVKLLDPAPITALRHLKTKQVRGGSGGVWVVTAVLTHLALLIQQVQDARLALNELQAQLAVTEVDKHPRDPLHHILLLIQLKDVLEGRDRKSGVAIRGQRCSAPKQQLSFHMTPD